VVATRFFVKLGKVKVLDSGQKYSTEKPGYSVFFLKNRVKLSKVPRLTELKLGKNMLLY